MGYVALTEMLRSFGQGLTIRIVQFTQVVFEALQALFLSLICKHLIYSREVEQWYISALGLITNEVRYFQECSKYLSRGVTSHRS